jgi:hypothetical protein
VLQEAAAPLYAALSAAVEAAPDALDPYQVGF